MVFSRFRVFLLFFQGIAALACLSAQGQNSGPPAFLREEPLSVEGIEERIEQIQSDESIAEADKTAALTSYKSAVSELSAAIDFEARTLALEGAEEANLAETASIRAELERRRAGEAPSVVGEEELPADAGADAIAARLTVERSRVSELGRQLREMETELSSLESLPASNRQRLADISRLLAEAETSFSRWVARTPSTVRDRADLANDQSRIRRLRAELALLQAETPTVEPRRQNLQARRDLASSDLSLARERVARLERRTGQLVTARIGAVERLLRELDLESLDEGGELRAMTEATRDVARRNETVLQRIAAAEAQHDRSLEELERLRSDAEKIRAQFEIGGLEAAFSEIMLDLRRTLPTPQTLRASIADRRQTATTARLEAFRTEREIEASGPPENLTVRILETLREKGADENDLELLRPGLLEFAQNRDKLFRDLVEGNRRLAERLGDTDLITNEKLAVAAGLREFLRESLVWVASSPPLGLEAFAGLRSALSRVAGPGALAEYAEAILRIGAPRWVLAVLLAGVLLLPRRHLRRLLLESGQRTRRISTDGIGNTVKALAASLWLALPVPTLLLFFGWAFVGDSRSPISVYALGQGMLAPAMLLLVLRFSAVACWAGGVGEMHFRWRRDFLDALYKALMRLIFFYLPAHLLIAIWWNDVEDLSAFQGPGRLFFIAAMIAVALVLNSFLKRCGRILARSEGRQSWLLKLRRFWFIFLMMLPLSFAVLAAVGHFLTAVALIHLVKKTLLVVFAGVFAYGLLTRWAAIRQRRMALADALAQREARRAAKEEAAAEREEGGPDAEIAEQFAEFIEEDEPVDWATVGEQTRHLIRAVVVLSALFGGWLAWADSLPMLSYLDKRSLFGEFSVGDLLSLVLIGSVTWIVFQNLPGLLELGFLRALEVESGVRNAVVTLCQYFVVAVGVVVASQAIGLDWSKLGWIAAALSVGLGFGLQEVVANFVSGLILLFERPIRVGDIITVGGVDGVVTKIRIRATTITNWDKKEFIVPNKEFVTGTIMNWTLSTKVNRLVFPVGIAYGSDTEKARSILLEIAAEQPEVLQDPAPSAVFESFGDSSLDFSLRCFLGSTESRLAVTHRINTLIHERFAAAGIEIPFPQRDVHLIPRPEGEGKG